MRHIYRHLRPRPLALVILLALTATPALADYDFEVDGIYYNITSSSDLTVEVTSNGSNSYGGTITIPEAVTYDDVTYSVTSIGERAFYYCTGLTSIEIPGSVTSIEDYAFMYCDGLTSVDIPNYVTTIGYSSFEHCANLTAVSLGESLTTIGEEAFYNCYSLASIEIPSSVTTIGRYAFCGCKSLVSVTIPDDVTSIGSSAFSSCTSLTQVTIGENVTAIPFGLFYGCAKLTSITIPASVTSIGEEAFCECAALASITIGEGVTSIDFSAFSGCTSLTSVNVDNDNSYYSSKDAVLYNKDFTTLVFCPAGLTSVTILEGVTSIGERAFEDCTNLTSVTIPNSVMSIEESAFEGCTSLTSITIPESVTSIGEEAFDDCSILTSINVDEDNSYYSSVDGVLYNKDVTVLIFWPAGLTSIIIPASVTSIELGAFNEGSGLTSLTSLNPEPPVCDTDAFEEINKGTCVLYVPEGSKEVYAAASQWSAFLNIVEIDVTGVESVTAAGQAEPAVPRRYGVDGVRIDKPRPGINIIRYSDGTTRKVYVK